MAIVVIIANNTRIEDAENTTGWASIGGGAGPSAEPSFAYQGTNLINRKVTGTAGFYYDPTLDGGVTHDMTAAAKATLLVKAIVSDYSGLNGVSGLRPRIGGGGGYYEYLIAGTDAKINSLKSYPSRGGLIIVAIDPNIAAYRNATVGSPILTAVDYMGLEANFDTSTAKSENVGLDALDLGTGLTLTGGGGADADGIYQDFVDADEGTIINRWGFASSTFDQVLLLQGKLTIGGTGVTIFKDTGAKILWVDGLFAPGFSKVFVDLQNAGTSVIDGAGHTGLGNTLSADSRPDYEVVGTAGVFILNGPLTNFRNVILTSACSIYGSISALDITQSGAIFLNAEIETTSLSGIATIDDVDLSKITDTNFIQGGLGHAIEITSPGTYTLNGLTYDGYNGVTGSNLIANSGANDTVIYNNSGGLVTFNISGGGTPSIRNGVGATTAVNNTVPITITAFKTDGTTPLVGASVYIKLVAGDGGSVILNTETDNSGIATIDYNFISTVSIDSNISEVRSGSKSIPYQPFTISGNITSSGYQLTAILQED